MSCHNCPDVVPAARWRNLGVPGEAEFKNKGVAYCPHCDGPDWLGDTVERTAHGEIVVNNHGAMNMPGVFAAGDCTNSPARISKSSFRWDLEPMRH